MTRRPTLYLTNWPSRSQHGPGRRICVMARPRRWERGDGRLPLLAPDPHRLQALRDGQITEDEYRRAYERGVQDLLAWDVLAPSRLLYCQDGDTWSPVQDGDTLLCACARPDSPRRTHECHLEWLAPYLARAGWRVVLYGKKVAP